MKTKILTPIFALILLLVGVWFLSDRPIEEVSVGAPKQKVVTVDQVLNFIEAHQDDRFLSKGQYQMILKGETWQDKYIMPDDIEVHWYESKKGKGYIVTQTRVIETSPRGSTTYKGEIRRWGFGPQADEFTHDWKIQ